MDWGTFKALREEWPTVKLAPWTFALIALVGCAVGFGISTLWWSGTVSVLRERVSLYQDRLQGASPDQAAQRIAALESRIKDIEPKPQRHLTDEQRKKLIEVMKPLASSLQQIALYTEGGREPAQFSVEFFKTFKDAGLDPIGPFISFPSLIYENGILVGMADPNKPSELALKFIEALRSANLEVGTTSGPGSGNKLDFDLFICGY
jgi:hypothetical protein